MRRRNGHALIDVRGHVHHVTCGWHEHQQAISCRLGFVRLISLHQVNVEMQRARMILILRDYFLSQPDNL